MKLNASLLAALFFLPTLGHAAVLNKVNITGKIYAVSPPVQTASGSSSKFVTYSLTNSVYLDILVRNHTIADKRGYTLVEILDNEGTSQGLFAYNATTGSRVQLGSGEVFIPTDTAGGITAETTTTKQTPSGPVVSHSENFIASGSQDETGTVSAYMTGTRATQFKTLKVSGSTTTVTYISMSYTAQVRGTTPDETALDIKMTSSGSVYVP